MLLSTWQWAWASWSCRPSCRNIHSKTSQLAHTLCHFQPDNTARLLGTSGALHFLLELKSFLYFPENLQDSWLVSFLAAWSWNILAAHHLKMNITQKLPLLRDVPLFVVMKFFTAVRWK